MLRPCTLRPCTQRLAKSLLALPFLLYSATAPGADGRNAERGSKMAAEPQSDKDENDEAKEDKENNMPIELARLFDPVPPSPPPPKPEPKVKKRKRPPRIRM